jgi:PAS domain S-box-containing protein
MPTGARRDGKLAGAREARASVRRASDPAAAAGPSPTARRLELTERLLVEVRARACAEATLDWLAATLPMQRALCAAISENGDSLTGLAGLDVPHAAVERFHVDLSDRNHPLVLTLGSREPVPFPAGARRIGPTPLGNAAFVAVPLDIGQADATLSPAIGLLLLDVPSLDPAQGAEVEWAARLLATRLTALWYGRATSEIEKRRRRLSWLTSILDLVDDPILMADSDRRTLLANHRAEYLLSSDEGMSEGRRRAVALNNMLFSASHFGPDGDAGRREVLLVDPVEGHDLLFELLTHTLEVGPGEEATVSVLRNVTDLQRAVRELEENYFRLRAADARTRAERDRLELTLASTVDPILVTDPAGNIELMNPPAERLLATEQTDREAERRVQGNDAMLTSLLSKLYAGSTERIRENLTLTDPSTGEEVPVEAIATRVVSRHGEDSAVVTVLHDLTETMEKAALYEEVARHSRMLEVRVRDATGELAEQNELLRRQALQLEQASAMKSQFLANASHELRTPLNAIIGHAQLLLEGISGELAPRQLEKVRRLDSNAQHLLAIINDLLDITRIESGKLPVRIERFSVSRLIEEVAAELEPLVPSERVEVRVDIARGLPEVESDRKKIKQVVSNLLSNALKFTAEGTVSLEARHDRVADRIVIAVTDTGKGVPEELQQTIFEPFGQSETSFRPIQKGTGLGLSICRRLTHLLGGTITLDSREGEGSTFRLELPRCYGEGEG